MIRYNQPTSVRLPKPLKDYLRRRAEIEDRKMAAVIVRILEESRQAFLQARKEQQK
jgi:hypothetical protein